MTDIELSDEMRTKALIAAKDAYLHNKDLQTDFLRTGTGDSGKAGWVVVVDAIAALLLAEGAKQGWEAGYQQGIEDQRISAEVYDGEIQPNRSNPQGGLRVRVREEEPEATSTAMIETLPWFIEAKASSDRDMANMHPSQVPTWFRPYQT